MEILECSGSIHRDHGMMRMTLEGTADEFDPPVFIAPYPTAAATAGDAGKVEVMLNEGGTCHFKVVRAEFEPQWRVEDVLESATGPSEVAAGFGLSSDSGNFLMSRDFDGLMSETIYSALVVCVDDNYQPNAQQSVTAVQFETLDVSPPVFAEIGIHAVGGTTVDLRLTINENGDCYVMAVRDADGLAPTVDEIVSGSLGSEMVYTATADTTADTDTVITLTDLPSQTDLTAHFACEDTTEPPNRMASSASLSFTTLDVTGPAWFGNSYPQIATTHAESVELSVALNEPGTCFAVALTDLATAPSAARVLSQTDANGDPPVSAGQVPVGVVGTVYTLHVTGLSSETAYDVYVACEDDSEPPNPHEAPVLLNVQTLDNTPPTFTSEPVIVGNIATKELEIAYALSEGDCSVYVLFTDPNAVVSVDEVIVGNLGNSEIGAVEHLGPVVISGTSSQISHNVDLPADTELQANVIAVDEAGNAMTDVAVLIVSPLCAVGGCSTGEQCDESDICESRVCDAGSCAAPTCSDAVKNSDEYYIDCGGTTAACEACADSVRMTYVFADTVFVGLADVEAVFAGIEQRPSTGTWPVADVVSLTELVPLSPRTVVIVPPLHNNLWAALDDEARSHLAALVSTGGTVVVHGSSLGHGITFLNGLIEGASIGAAVDAANSGTDISKNGQADSLSSLLTSPATLSASGDVYPLDPATLPAASYRLYTVSGSDDIWASATEMTLGWVFYLAMRPVDATALVPFIVDHADTTDVSTRPIVESAPTIERVSFDGDFSGGRLEVLWQQARDPLGDDRTIGYWIWYQVQSAYDNGEPLVRYGESILDATARSGVVWGLDANTWYVFAVSADNDGEDAGLPSEVVIAETPAPYKPTQPLSLATVSASGGAVTLSWQPPLDTGGIPIDEYEVSHYFADGESTPNPLPDSVVVSGDVLTASVGGLTAVTSYSFVVTASNAVGFCTGPSDPSDPVGSTTAVATAPGPPSASAIEPDGGFVTVSISPPHDGGGSPITSYDATVARTSGEDPLELDTVTVGGDTESVTVYGLLAATQYSVELVASNAIGRSSGFTPVEFTTAAATVPFPPLNLRSDESLTTGGSIVLQWDAPLTDGGVAITGYDLMASDAGSDTPTTLLACEGSGLSMQCTHARLVAETEYSYKIRARNNVGSGSYTDVVTLSTAASSTPGAPPAPVLAESGTCEAVGGNVEQPPCLPSASSLELVLTPPADTGGVSLDAFRLSSGSLDDIDVAADGENSVTVRIYQLGASMEYSFTVAGVNAAGVGGASAALVVSTAAFTKADAPAAPVRDAEATTGGALCIELTAPLDAGLAPEETPTEYELFIASAGQGVTDPLPDEEAYRCGDAEDPLCVSAGIVEVADGAACAYRDFLDATLSANEDYKIAYLARTSAGRGALSPFSVLSTSTTATAPGVPESIVINSISSRTIVLDWSLPMDGGGSPITDFDVTHQKADESEAAVVVRVSTAEVASEPVGFSYSIEGLEVETLYTVSVRAVQTDGTTGEYAGVGTDGTVETLPGIPGVVVFNEPAVQEITEAAITLEVQLSRVNGTAGVLTVEIAPLLESSTATADEDFAAGVVEVQFADEQVSAVASLTFLQDDVFEETERVEFELSSPGEVWLDMIAVDIRDDGDAGLVALQDTGVQEAENRAMAFVLASRVAAAGHGLVDVNVDLQLEWRVDEAVTSTTCDVLGVCVDNVETVSVFGSTTLSSGSFSTIISVPISDNDTYEPSRQLVLWLLSVEGGAQTMAGSSSASVEVLDDGDVSAPARPESPSVSDVTGGSITLLLGSPAHTGGASITSILVEVADASVSSGWYEAVTLDADATTAFVTQGVLSSSASLQPMTQSTEYRLRTRFANSAGVSEASSSILAATGAASPPSLVPAVETVVVTGGTLTVQWSPPEDRGGIALTSYTLFGEPHEGGNVPAASSLTAIATVDATQVSFTLDRTTIPVDATWTLLSGTVFNVAVRSSNALGAGPRSSVHQATLGESSLPSAPRNVFHLGSTGGALNIRYVLPADSGGVPAAELLVRAHCLTSEGDVLVEPSSDTENSILVEGLSESTPYAIAVRASNGFGERVVGTASLVSGATELTIDYAGVDLVANPQLDIRFAVAAGDSVTLEDADTGGRVHVVLAADADERWTSSSLPLANTYGGGDVTGTLYSKWSEATVVEMFTTEATLPKAPAAPVFVEATGGAITFRLLPPLDTGGIPVNGFAVFMREAGCDPECEFAELASTLAGATVTHTEAYLKPLTSYELYAVANNVLSSCLDDSSDTSEVAVMMTTNVTDPTPPVDLEQGDVVGGGLVSAEWEAPADIGGASTVSYSLELVADDLCCGPVNSESTAALDWQTVYSGDEESHVAYGLEPLSCHCLRVSAITAFGSSDFSEPVTITTEAPTRPGVGGAPRLVAATGGSLTIEWDLPEDDGGSDITSYTVSYRAVSAAATVSAIELFSSTTQTTISGLVASTQYSVRTAATNDIGRGDLGPSDTFTTTAATVPSQIPAPALDGFPRTSGGKLGILWQVPTDDGGAAIESYDLRVTTSSSQFTTVVAATGSHVSSGNVYWEVTGLSAATQHNFQVRARNIVGVAPYSVALTASTIDASAPSQVVDLRPASVAGGSFVLQFSQPLDAGGLPISGYWLSITGPSRTGGSLAETDVAVSSGFVVTGLAPVSEYDVSVTVTTASADGTQSFSSAPSTITVSTSAVTLPMAPQEVRATGVSSTELRVSWLREADTGGVLVVDGYVIEYAESADGDVSAPFPGSFDRLEVDADPADEEPLAALVESLNSDAYYVVRVRAVNTAGEGPASSVVAALTEIPNGAPRSPFLRSYGATWAELCWKQALDLEGYTVTGSFELESKVDGELWVAHDPVTPPESSKFIPSAAAADFPADAAIVLPVDPDAVLFCDVFDGLLPSTDYDLRVSSGRLEDGEVEQEFGTPSVSVPLTTLDTEGVSVLLDVHGQLVTGEYGADERHHWIIHVDNNEAIGTHLHITSFEVECDYDVVQVGLTDPSQYAEADPSFDATNLQWRGGCRRGRPFDLTIAADGDVSVTLSSDATVHGSGVTLTWASLRELPDDVVDVSEASAQASQMLYPACPGEGTVACGGTGVGACQVTGECVCEEGYVGEACENIALCPGSPICDRLDDAITIAPPPLGSDTNGVGGVGNPTFVGGTAPKPFATLAHALSVRGTGTGTILVYPGEYTSVDGSGNCNIELVGHNVLIESVLGADFTTVDCSSASRWISFTDDSSTVEGFHVTGGAAQDGGAVLVTGASSSVTIAACEFQGCSAAQDGGAIAVVDGASTALSDVEVLDNTATARGGGVFVDGSSEVTMEDCSIEGNVADVGGGIYAAGGSLVDGSGDGASSVVQTNSANRGGNLGLSGDASSAVGLHVASGVAPMGANVYCEGADATVPATVSDCVIDGSSAAATLEGGGIHVAGGGLSVVRTSIEECGAQNGGGLWLGPGAVVSGDGVTAVTECVADAGGGVYLSGAGAQVENINVNLCSAAGSGGGVASGAASGATARGLLVTDCDAVTGGGVAVLADSFLAVEESTVERCVAHYGGGSVAHNGSTLLLGTSQLRSCSTDQRGGGLYVHHNTRVEGGFISECTSPTGGGVGVAVGATTTLAALQVARSTAVSGGGLVAEENATVDLERGTELSENVVSGLGGGVLFHHGSVLVSNDGSGVVRGNFATDGGGIACEQCGSTRVSGLTISGNGAVRGGGLFASSVDPATEMHLSNVLISSNSATLSGGGVFASWLTTVATSVVVGANNVMESHSEDPGTDVHGNRGGGVRLVGGQLVAVASVDISGNFADSGAGIAVSDGTTIRGPDDSTIHTLTTTENIARRLGGGLLVDSPAADVDISQVLFMRDEADQDGGAVAVSGGRVRFVQVEVQSGRAGRNGGGLKAESAVLMLSDIVIANSTAVSGGGIFLGRSSATAVGTLRVLDCAAQDGGGLFVSGDSSFDGGGTSLTLVARNSATERGGGAFLQDTTSLAALTLDDNSVEGIGGAIFVGESSSSTITGVSVNGNEAVAGGGGIYVATDGWSAGDQGQQLQLVTVLRCSFTSNSAGEGGAAALHRSGVVFSGCEFTNNAVADATQGGGGAVLARGPGGMVLEDVVMSSNTAQAGTHGGAVSCIDCELNVSSSSFVSNSAPSGSGGALFLQNVRGVATIADSAISGLVPSTRAGGNARLSCPASSISARIGAGIFVEDQVASRQLATVVLEISRVVFARLGANEGGALHAESVGVRISESVIRDSCAAQVGGGLSSSSALVEVAQSTIQECTAVFDGGAMFLSKETLLDVSSSVIRGCSAISGGAAFVDSVCELYVRSGSVIEDCLAEEDGGAVNLGRDSTFYLEQSTVSHCVAEQAGGAVYASNSRDLSLISSSLMHNVGVEGGALALKRQTSLSVVDTTVSDNYAEVGGALWAGRDCDIHIEDSELDGNSALTVGGGISLVTIGTEGAEVALSAVRLTSNSADSGGGIAVDGSTNMTITGCEFEGNSVTSSGGGLYAASALSRVEVYDSLFKDNAATSSESRGGAAFFAGVTATHPVLQGVVFDNNTAVAGRNVFWVYDGGEIGLECISCSQVASAVRRLSAHGEDGPDSSDVRRLTDHDDDVDERQLFFATQSVAVQVVSVPDGELQPGVAIQGNQASLTVTVVDFYGEVSVLDDDTQCTLSTSGGADTSVIGAEVDAAGGAVEFQNTAVSGVAGVPIQLNISCNVPEAPGAPTALVAEPAENVTLEVRLGSCALGWELTETLSCEPCPRREYSTLGALCNPCPVQGASCTREVDLTSDVFAGITLNDDASAIADTAETLLGVPYPKTLEGYWLFQARSSLVDEDTCRDIATRSDGSCRHGLTENSDGACIDASVELYACENDLEFYRCEIEEACLPDVTQTNITHEYIDSVYESSDPEVAGMPCADGYYGVRCSLCKVGWRLGTDLRCRPCGDGDFNLATRLWFGFLVVIFVVFSVSGLLAYTMGAATTIRCLKRTGKCCCPCCGGRRNSKAVAPLDRFSRTGSDMAMRPVSREAHSPKKPNKKKAKKGCVARMILNLERFKVLRVEKFKIAVAFAQIIHGFRAAFLLEWPTNVRETWDMFAFMTLDLVRIGNIDCIVTTSYYSTFGAMFITPLLVALLLWLFYMCRKRRILKRIALWESVHGRTCHMRQPAVFTCSGPASVAGLAVEHRSVDACGFNVGNDSGRGAVIVSSAPVVDGPKGLGAPRVGDVVLSVRGKLMLYSSQDEIAAEMGNTSGGGDETIRVIRSGPLTSEDSSYTVFESPLDHTCHAACQQARVDAKIRAEKRERVLASRRTVQSSVVAASLRATQIGDARLSLLTNSQPQDDAPLGIDVWDSTDDGVMLRRVTLTRLELQNYVVPRERRPRPGDWVIAVGDNYVTHETSNEDVLDWLREAEVVAAKGGTTRLILARFERSGMAGIGGSALMVRGGAGTGRPSAAAAATANVAATFLSQASPSPAPQGAAAAAGGASPAGAGFGAGGPAPRGRSGSGDSNGTPVGALAPLPTCQGCGRRGSLVCRECHGTYTLKQGDAPPATALSYAPAHAPMMLREPSDRSVRSAASKGTGSGSPRPNDDDHYTGNKAEFHLAGKHILRIWSSATQLPGQDSALTPGVRAHKHGRLSGDELCRCIPRDPHSDEPSDALMCRRGLYQQELRTFKNRVAHVVLLMTLVSYAPLAQKTLGLWNCRQIGDRWFLASDSRITCFNNAEWWFFAVWGIVSAAIYVIGSAFSAAAAGLVRSLTHTRAPVPQSRLLSGLLCSASVSATWRPTWSTSSTRTLPTSRPSRA